MQGQALAGSTEFHRDGLLAGFLAANPLLDLAKAPDTAGLQGSQAAVFAPNLLQDLPDYRGALQRWFGCVAVGGTLVLTVPHAFLDPRQDRLPSARHPRQHRLYTPASLLAEVEEALAPNSYRVRWLADRDQGYDYAADRATPPLGQHDIALAIERIDPPRWDLSPPAAAAAPPPEYGFEPVRTRLETMAASTAERILLLKLDHLGDFIIGVPALHAVRAHFPAAHITLVVGPWNESLARRIDIADELLIFDAFPRNAAEAPVDVGARIGHFDALVTGHYDLAIDLRTFPDTRILLRNVDAATKAGIGNRGVHPFLDIFLPLDPMAEHFDHAWAGDIAAHEFAGQDCCERTRFQISCQRETARDAGSALTWGPYRNLLPGNYLFQPFIDVDFGRPGLLAYDIAIDTQRIAYGLFDGTADVTVPFTVEDNAGLFEFRLFAVGAEPVSDFRFYGGRLIKQGAASMLHQSEYLTLLVALVAMRVEGGGLFPSRAEGR